MGETNQNILAGIVIIFGALVHATYKMNQKLLGENVKLTWRDIAALAFMASFTGLMGFFISVLYFDDFTLRLVVAGVSAFLGIEGLAVIVNTLLKVIVSTIQSRIK